MVKKKSKSFICYASSPFPPPQPSVPSSVKICLRNNLKTLKQFLTHPATVAITTSYGAGLAGHVVPQFHKILLTEGIVPASGYAIGAVFKGQIDPDSNVGKSLIYAVKGSLKFIPKKEHKLFFRELSSIYGEEGMKKIKKMMNYRGGGYIYYPPNWVLIWTQIYLWSLVCLYCVLFVQNLSESINENPEIGEILYQDYLTNVIPYGFAENKKSFSLNSLFICDDIYLLGIDVNF